MLKNKKEILRKGFAIFQVNQSVLLRFAAFNRSSQLVTVTLHYSSGSTYWAIQQKRSHPSPFKNGKYEKRKIRKEM